MKLAGIEFKSKKSLVEHIRKIKDSYAPGNDVNAVDAPVLMDLIQNHPESMKLVGNGIKGFKVDYSPSGWGDICFWVKRIDGSEDFFSYRKCIDAGSKLSQIASVMRLAVKDQVDEFRQKTFFDKKSMPCPITGEVITYSSCHVDHAAPSTFEILRNGFLFLQKQKGLYRSINEIELVPNTGGVGYVFADSQLMEDWVSYHQKNARLRCVSAAANLGDLRRTKHWIPLKA